MENKTYSILLVEDDEIDVMNVKRAFKKTAINNPLFVASNGIEALNVLRSGKINLPYVVLLDLNMPKMNGIEFLTELRKDEMLSNAMVFVMTTSNEESDKKHAYKLNVAGYIVKPLGMDDFLNTINTLKNFWETNTFLQ